MKMAAKSGRMRLECEVSVCCCRMPLDFLQYNLIMLSNDTEKHACPSTLLQIRPALDQIPAASAHHIGADYHRPYRLIEALEYGHPLWNFQRFGSDNAELIKVYRIHEVDLVGAVVSDKATVEGDLGPSIQNVTDRTCELFVHLRM